MNLQHIRYFLELAKELHFWNTAEKVYITQSALSRHIMALEDELGFQLFKRNKRNVELTDAGKLMQKEWTKLIFQIDNIHKNARKIHDGEFGVLRIGHPGSITYSYLPDITSKITQKYPLLNIELIELMTVNLEKALLDFHFDAGFRREVSENPLLETKLLFSENFGLVLPPEKHISVAFLENIKDFSKEKFILPNIEGGSSYSAILRKIFEDSNFQPDVQLTSEFGSTIMSLISRGLGFSVLPISYQKNAPLNVQFIPLPYSSALYLQWRKGDQSPILKNFLKVIDDFKFDII